MSAATSSATVFSIGYDFHAGNGTPNSGTDNGNVFGITNYKDTSRNQTFTYDPLNRLLSAQNAGTNCAATTANGKTEYWGNSYTYDAWGNLLQKSVTKCSAENAIFTMNGNNQAFYYPYDAAGNMLNDGIFAYTFDQENRITGTGGYTYTYDGDGNRVRKSNSSTSGTLYWYMTPGIVAETDLAGTTKSEYIFFDGERVARRDGVNGAGGVFYYISDHLKTASVITDSAGTIKSESDYYPWGGELQITANDSNHYKFTGKERDSETGLDYFGARYYSNGLGRWVSADWSATPVPVPYADFGDPQSLNLYGYVRGLPTSRVDADGHCCDWQYGVDFTTGALKGVVSSASFGWVGAPKAGDSEASLLGQTYGTFVEGLVGAGIMSKGIGDAGVGLALAPETGGASLAVSGQGLLEMGGGGLMEAGAAKNTTAIAMVAKNSQGSSSTQESTKPHGNTAGDQPAELYEKYDKNGNFQKHGVSQNSNKRYTQKQLNGGRIKVVGKGPRRQMLAKERQKVETNPGPENHEPWAGKQKKN